MDEEEDADVLLFGTGYGCRYSSTGTCYAGQEHSAATDAATVDEVIRAAMGVHHNDSTGFQCIDTVIDIVVPHGHDDHANPEFVYELEQRGHTINAIYVHTAGATDVQNFANASFCTSIPDEWDEDDMGVPQWSQTITSFGSCGSPPCCEENVTESALVYQTSVGTVWFRHRGSSSLHTLGAIDLVLDYDDSPTVRWVVLGSAWSGGAGGCGSNLTNVVAYFRAHGNYINSIVCGGSGNWPCNWPYDDTTCSAKRASEASFSQPPSTIPTR